MAPVPARRSDNPVAQLAQDSRVANSLDWFVKNLSWIADQQIHITEIPAPEFAEKTRADFVRKLLEASGLKVQTDAAGNVIGERPGTDGKNVVLLTAHLDTVFPAETDVRVRHNGTRLEAPGISDNGAGLSAMIAVARALAESGLRTGLTVVFAADVGEEGEGNLRGIRQLVDGYRGQLRAVSALDGASTDHITTMAVASRRLELAITGPGGHSWSDFGAPNPIAALSRAIVRFSAVRLPAGPRPTYNFGIIEGGSSVNSIPNRAAVRVDMRSEDESELDRLEAALRAAADEGISEELGAAREGSGSLEAKFRVLGVRPAGKLPDDSPLLAAVRNVDQYLGNNSRLERSSTDANIPLSLGIPAISLGGGGRGGGSHSLNEWYDPTGRELGLKRILLTVLAVAGVQP